MGDSEDVTVGESDDVLSEETVVLLTQIAVKDGLDIDFHDMNGLTKDRMWKMLTNAGSPIEILKEICKLSQREAISYLIEKSVIYDMQAERCGNVYYPSRLNQREIKNLEW